MRIRTITADKMTDALRLIREQLGPEALILSTRKVERNGHATLEITAAVNDDEPPPAAPSPARPPAAPVHPLSAAPSAHVPNLLASTLASHGMPPELAATLQTALPGLEAAGFTSAEALAMVLGKKLNFQPGQPGLLASGGPEPVAQVLIGPHGAGKTTLVAKLALQARQAGRQVGLLSLDDQKIGGFEPLAITAEILGESAHLITRPADLHVAMAALGPKTPLLLDTAGLNPFAPRVLAQLQQRLQELNLAMAVHLVLPANLNAEDLQNLPVACQRLSPASLIFTKLDCTTRFGPLVATAAHSGLPVGLATHAADLATPPLHLTPQWLAEALLELPAQPWEYAQ